MAAPRKVKSRVTEIRKYMHDITFFRLRPEISCKFKPGQFLHLAIDPYDPSFNWPESRVFSIANSPSSSDHIDILVSPKGNFTQRMIRELQVGSEVWIKLPFGIFDFRASVDRSVVLIAGGTGITPFASFLESLLDIPGNYKKIILIYGVRDTGLIVFDSLLSRCKNGLQHFDLRIFCEGSTMHQDLVLSPGMIPVDNIVQETCQLPDPIFYLSGPPAMILRTETALKEAGIQGDKVLYDKWE